MTEIELEMENDTELRIECEQIYIMDDYEQLIEEIEAIFNGL